jgi:hypothetical protein
MISRRSFATVLLVGLSSVAGAWQTDLRTPGDDFPAAIAFAPDGDVYLGADVAGRASVLRLRRDDGKVGWRYEPDQADGPIATVVPLGDDVVVDGRLRHAGEPYGRHVVVRLSGSTGAEVWRDAAPSTTGGGESVVDAHGDVVVARVVDDTVDVRKLAGATGGEVWRYTASHPLAYDGDFFGLGLAVDAHGDVAVGWATIDKLDGGTGAPLWSAAVPFGTQVAQVQVDRTSDLLVEVGSVPEEPLDYGTQIRKIDGQTGSLEWTQDTAEAGMLDIDPSGAPVIGRVWGGNRVGTGLYAHWHATLIRLDPTDGSHQHKWPLGSLPAPILLSVQNLGLDGDVLATAVSGAFEGRPARLHLARLRRGSPGVAWSRVLGRVPGSDDVSLRPHVAADADRTVAVAWVQHRRATGWDLRVVTLSGATGRRRRG